MLSNGGYASKKKPETFLNVARLIRVTEIVLRRPFGQNNGQEQVRHERILKPYQTPQRFINLYLRVRPGISQTVVKASKDKCEIQRHRQTARARDQYITPTTELEVADSPKEQVREEEVR